MIVLEELWPQFALDFGEQALAGGIGQTFDEGAAEHFEPVAEAADSVIERGGAVEESSAG